MNLRLKQKRKAIGITQKIAADRIGVRQSTVAMWETGRCKPRTDTLERIAKVYHCRVSDFFA